jgi:ElaB/YqjD/DUF883 family membrane-anchored ribosome-binding protein
MGKDPDAIEREIEERRERIGERVDALTYKADVKSRMGDAISERKDRVTGKVSEFFAGAGDSVSNVTNQVSDQAPSTQDVKHQTKRAAGLVRENPLGLAIGAAAAGFIVGMLLPSTRAEDEKLGEAADAVKAKAMETGQEALSRGQQVAKDVAQTASQTARESGSQHASELADSARQNASDAAQTAQSSAQNQT